MDGFVSVVEGLGREAKGLVSANHFDASNISARQVHKVHAPTPRIAGVLYLICSSNNMICGKCIDVSGGGGGGVVDKSMQ